MRPCCEQRAPLPGAVEGEHVVAAGERRRAVPEIELLDGPVVAAGQQRRRSRARVAVDAEEVAGQRRLPERDLEDLGRRLHERGGPAERLGLAGVARHQAWVEGHAHEHDAGGPEVGARPQVGEAGRLAPAVPLGLLGEGRDGLGGPQPLVVPAVEVGALHPAGGRQALADVRPAVGRGPHRAQELRVEEVVLEGQVGHDRAYPPGARPHTCRRNARSW